MYLDGVIYNQQENEILVSVRMRYLQHFCLISVLLTQVAFGQLLPVGESMSPHSQQTSIILTPPLTTPDEQSRHQDCTMPLQECLSDCQSQKPCISYCNTSIFIPSLLNEFIEPINRTEPIKGQFWTSQTTIHTPILFPPINTLI